MTAVDPFEPFEHRCVVSKVMSKHRDRPNFGQVRVSESPHFLSFRDINVPVRIHELKPLPDVPLLHRRVVSCPSLETLQAPLAGFTDRVL